MGNKDRISAIKKSFTERSLKMGGYSVTTTVIVLAIAIMVNVLAGSLPTTLTQIDTSSTELFTISEQTEKIVKSLDEDVTIYWIVQSGYEDATLETMLSYYEGLNNKLDVVKKDPDVYPTFATKYTDTVENNSLVVVTDSKYRYVSSSDIYEYDYSNYYTTGTYDVSFAGENAITSAINYVVSDNIPKVYYLTGHGESELSTELEDAITRDNIDIEELSLLSVEAVPEDTDAILIYAPQTDISEDEKEKLLTYLQTGGNMILLSNPPADGALENLEALMEYYGVSAAEGIVVEGDSGYSYWGMPYYLLPEIKSHTITEALISGGYYTLVPIAQGLVVSDELRDGLSVTKLLTTSDNAYSKTAGYYMETYDKEDGDIDGPFSLAVAITETVDDTEETNIVWISSAYLVDDGINEYVSGGNHDFFLNALNWMCEKEESISIRSKSLSYEYLTMDSETSSSLSIVMIGVIPVAYLLIGIVVWVRRKRR